MASDDDDELAQMRAERDARTGGGASLAELRGKQPGKQTEASYFEEDTLKDRKSIGQQATQQRGDSDEDDGPVELLADEEDAAATFQLREQFPLSFGEQEKAAANLEAVHLATMRQEAAEPSSTNGEHAAIADRPAVDGEEGAAVGPSLEEGPGSGPGDQDREEDPYNLPISHEVALEGHGKAVSALDVDHTGSRVLSGSRDNSLRIFDFNGMKANMRSFRKLEPSEGHPMLAASWSPTGDAFLAVSGSAQIKVYDRDGILRGESLRGDMYIRDQKNTKGHVSPATSGQWHPTDKTTAMTCSEDGTLRLWDTATVAQKSVIKPQLPRVGRTTVSACAFNADGASIAAGLVDGSIHIWDAKGSKGRSAAIGAVPVPRAQMVVKQDWRYVSGGAMVTRGAHAADTDITSLAFSRDNLTLLSRAADDTVKVWDLRKFKAPVHVFGDLPTLSSTTGVCFSPDERLILTGVSAGRDGSGGGAVILDRERLIVARRIGMPASVVAVHWHTRLNQILLGVGDKNSGAVHVLYSPSLSERGVLMCAHRKLRPKDPFDFETPLVIHTPHALPLFREDRPRKRHLDEKPKDAAQRFKPDPGSTTLTGTGTGGRIGATGGTLLTQYILKNQGKLNNPKDEDIRAKILRHEGKEDTTSKLFTAAYKDTQPKPIYAESDEDEEEK